MYLQINTAELRPSTLAAMIADLMDMPSPYNLPTIKALMDQLETNVGEEESIKYIIDANVTPEQLIEMWDLVAA